MSTDRVQQQIRLHNRYANQFRESVRGALKNQYKHYTSSLQAHGAAYTLSHSHDLFDTQLTKAITSLYVHVANSAGLLTYRALQRLPKIQKKAQPNIGPNVDWTKRVLDYFNAHLFDKVVLPISETTKEVIQATIKKGVAEGWTIDRMVLEIERKDFLDGRVERILRTEINRAINYGNELAGDTFRYKVKKEWIAVHDNRTRHAHAEADGQTVGLDEKFHVWGEYLQFPGDPNGKPENTINCRCVESILPVRDNRGALQPKETEEPLTPVTGAQRTRIQNIIDLLLQN